MRELHFMRELQFHCSATEADILHLRDYQDGRLVVLETREAVRDTPRATVHLTAETRDALVAALMACDLSKKPK